ncbi:MAG: NnrU protein [Gammaproteobacteria bacterium]|nr:MAG: NnrU protein [Gammaproteobacteria bacterium]
MALLVLGILLFAGIHFIPSLAPGLKASWLGRLGENGYKGTFALLALASFALIITGWRSAQPEFLYTPSPALRHPAMLLLVVAFLLMVVSSRNSRLSLLVRHPQLTGVTAWGIAHLLLNGDNRSLVLFGGMAVWALVEMITINRRDGAWIKGAAPSWGAEIVTLVIALVIVAVVVKIHPWLTGMPVI